MDSRKRGLFLLPLALLPLLLIGCAPGHERFALEAPASFWFGLWHGAIGLVTFTIGLFTDAVRFYEPANTGSWYDFGFILGVLCFWGGGTGSAMRARRR
jgi:hypothetical protein